MASQDNLSLTCVKIPWPLYQPANTCNSIKVFLYISYDARPKIADYTKDPKKLRLVPFCSNLDLWSSNPAAVRFELSNIFGSLGIDGSQHGRFIKQIEDNVSAIRDLNSEMLAFQIKITNNNTYSCLKSVQCEEECSICLQDIAGRGAITQCGHVFHAKCITKWLHRTTSCPLCRSVLLEN